VIYSQFIRGVFVQSAADVALIIDRGAPNSINSSHLVAVDGHHIFLPFFGGPDDRLALTLLVQLCQNNTSVNATVVWITKSEGDLETDSIIAKDRETPHQNFTITSIGGRFPDTVYAQQTTETRMNSQTVDHVLWSRVTSSETASSSRITFTQLQSPRPLNAALEYLSNEVIQRQLSPSTADPKANAPAPSKGFIVALGRARRLAVESHEAELRDIAAKSRAQSTGELRKTVGDVASAFIIGTPHQLLVFQASSASASGSSEV